MYRKLLAQVLVLYLSLVTIACKFLYRSIRVSKSFNQTLLSDNLLLVPVQLTLSLSMAQYCAQEGEVFQKIIAKSSRVLELGCLSHWIEKEAGYLYFF